MPAATQTVRDGSALRLALPLPFIASLLALSFSDRIATVPSLATSFFGACGLLVAWYAYLLVRTPNGPDAFAYEVQVIRVHWVQMLVHSTIYGVWGWFWPFIYGQIPLIVAQIAFAYAFGILLSWSRGERHRLGFGPVPIILSTNLFLTFKDEWFYLQFALIALGMLGKEFIRWQKDGRSSHIFNPSAFTLFVFSIALIVTGNTGLTWGNEIAVNLEIPPYIFYILFALGLVVQALFRVTLVTLGAAFALYVLGTLYTAATGIYWFLDAGIPIAVFLGLHLLVTDPATSPRTDLGRFLFGIGYGAGVFAMYGVLERLGAPSFYDKLLCVPLLNLAVRAIDRVVGRATWMTALIPARLQALDVSGRNFVYMGLWIALFALMAGTHFVGDGFPGQSLAFWKQACSEDRHNACRNLARIYADDCNHGHTLACTAVVPERVAARARSDGGDALEPVRMLARGCDLGRTEACDHLVRALGPRQRAELELACDAGAADSCYILGSTALFGLGTAPDRKAAFDNFARACERGSANGCGVMADMYRYGVGTARDATHALAGHERACSLSFAPSCQTFAAMLTKGEGAASDARRARAMLRRACLLGMVSVCEH